jgi:hypothetical protein
MFVVLLIQAGFYSFFGGGPVVGQAYKILGEDGEVTKEYNLEVTEAMKDKIARANELYLAGDIPGAKEEFGKLMKMRVNAGGTLSIEKFTELLPKPTDMIIKEDDEAEAGFIMLDGSNGKVIAEKVEDISRVIMNNDAVFQTMFYILNPNEFSAVVLPNKMNKINYGGRFYYLYRDINGVLTLKRYILFWWDLLVKDENIERGVLITGANSLIEKKRLDILLYDKDRYIFEQEGKQSLLGRVSSIADGLSLI